MVLLQDYTYSKQLFYLTITIHIKQYKQSLRGMFWKISVLIIANLKIVFCYLWAKDAREGFYNSTSQISNAQFY